MRHTSPPAQIPDTSRRTGSPRSALPWAAALLAAAALGSGCDIATVPTTASDGLGRPAVATRVLLEVEGLPPGVDTMVVEINSLALRRTRDQQWIPLVAGSSHVTLSPNAPSAELTSMALGADTYDRVEVVAEGMQLHRQGLVHDAVLDRDDATLAVQWVFDRDVEVTLKFDYRADIELTADRLDVVFAPLAHLE
ncbi:MAG: hypothetical protein JKY37_20630 [Nannocystaceae bacterium]|nr:hypothetical protein [Nannocystaceae bacterium]